MQYCQATFIFWHLSSGNIPGVLSLFMCQCQLLARNPNIIRGFKSTGYKRTRNLFAMSIFRLPTRRFSTSYRGSTAWFLKNANSECIVCNPFSKFRLTSNKFVCGACRYGVLTLVFSYISLLTIATFSFLFKCSPLMAFPTNDHQ